MADHVKEFRKKKVKGDYLFILEKVQKALPTVNHDHIRNFMSGRSVNNDVRKHLTKAIQQFTRTKAFKARKPKKKLPV